MNPIRALALLILKKTGLRAHYEVEQPDVTAFEQ
jgi:hypothetical protein